MYQRLTKTVLLKLILHSRYRQFIVGKDIVKTNKYLCLMIKSTLCALLVLFVGSSSLRAQTMNELINPKTDADTIVNQDSTVHIISLKDSIETDSVSVDSLRHPGVLKVTGDQRLRALIDKYIEINQDDCPNIIEGYRVQVFSTSGTGSSQKAREARTKFLTFYPSLKAYTDYEAPNFRVRVGDFRTKLEAEKIKKMISQEFPSCFIVPDYIVTKLSTEACQN